ncbi:MAG TPA: biopolymer transporter ExbD [Gammaproteobacteria bacterium]|nr:biopolymer transporter ExbD [Gammaproteobacteria bacterium]
MKLRDRAKWEDPELNLISLVDVVLMLLVFFVMTTHFVESPGLAVELPSAGAPPTYTKPDGIEVTVDAEGHYYVNQKPVADTNPATLRDALMAAAGERRDIPIVLRADARTTHQSVVTVMDVAGALGFAQLQILTTQPRANP